MTATICSLLEEEEGATQRLHARLILRFAAADRIAADTNDYVDVDLSYCITVREAVKTKEYNKWKNSIIFSKLGGNAKFDFAGAELGQTLYLIRFEIAELAIASYS